VTGADAEPARLVVPVSQRRLNVLRAAVAERGFPSLALTLSNDAGPVVAWANSAAMDLLGLSADELVGQELQTPGSVDRDGLPDWATVVSRTLEGDEESHFGEWQSAAIHTPDRSMSSIEVMLRQPDRKACVVWLRAVTEAERRAVEAQRESEHRFRALAEHAPVGIVLSEAGVRLGFANNRFAEIAGIERSALLGTRWLTTIHADDLADFLGTLDDVLAGSAVEAIVRMVSAANSQRWVQFRLSPVMTARRASGFIGTAEDITSRRAWEAQLSYQAGHDALTGLVNRRRLVDALSLLLTSRRSRDRDVAVLFCDLDGFKQINDTLGHDAGDRVLIEVARRLSSTAREHDLVARIAGDEFVVMITEIGSVEDAEAAAIRQLEALVPPIGVAGHMVAVSASIGVAMACDYDDAASLLQAADHGMYEAKRAGTGLYRVASADGPQPDGFLDGL
jgi:diguanylate cyclase (GGDEF)-like protein/PAS domain S-box-containing protein